MPEALHSSNRTIKPAWTIPVPGKCSSLLLVHGMGNMSAAKRYFPGSLVFGSSICAVARSNEMSQGVSTPVAPRAAAGCKRRARPSSLVDGL